MPSMMALSRKFSDTAPTFTSSSPGAGAGVGTSPSARFQNRRAMEDRFAGIVEFAGDQAGGATAPPHHAPDRPDQRGRSLPAQLPARHGRTRPDSIVSDHGPPGTDRAPAHRPAHHVRAPPHRAAAAGTGVPTRPPRPVVHPARSGGGHGGRRHRSGRAHRHARGLSGPDRPPAGPPAHGDLRRARLPGAPWHACQACRPAAARLPGRLAPHGQGNMVVQGRGRHDFAARRAGAPRAARWRRLAARVPGGARPGAVPHLAGGRRAARRGAGAGAGRHQRRHHADPRVVAEDLALAAQGEGGRRYAGASGGQPTRHLRCPAGLNCRWCGHADARCGPARKAVRALHTRRRQRLCKLRNAVEVEQLDLHGLGARVDSDFTEELVARERRRILDQRAFREYRSRTEGLVEHARTEGAGIHRPRHEFPERRKIRVPGLGRIVIVGRTIVDIGGDPDHVGNGLDTAEQARHFQLAPQWNAVAAVGQRFPYGDTLGVLAVADIEADGHVGRDDFPGGGRGFQRRDQPFHLLAPQECRAGVFRAHGRIFEKCAAAAGRERRNAFFRVPCIGRQILGGAVVIRHFVIVPLPDLRHLGGELAEVRIEHIVGMAATVFLQRFRDLAHFFRDDIAPDLAVFRGHLGKDGAVGINGVAVVDEKVRIAQAHRFIDFHAAKIGVDAPALAALVAAPVKAHGPGAIGRRRGPELSRDGLALDLRIVGIHVAHAHEYRLAGRQAAQVDTGREIGGVAGDGTNDAAGIGKTLAGIVFDDHLRVTVAAAPDDGPVIADVAELYARQHLGPLALTDANGRMPTALAFSPLAVADARSDTLPPQLGHRNERQRQVSHQEKCRLPFQPFRMQAVGYLRFVECSRHEVGMDGAVRRRAGGQGGRRCAGASSPACARPEAASAHAKSNFMTSSLPVSRFITKAQRGHRPDPLLANSFSAFHPSKFYGEQMRGLSLRTRAPPQLETILGADRLVAADLAVAGQVVHQLGHLQLAVLVFDHGNGAHLLRAAVVEPHFHRRLVGHVDQHHAVGGGPVGHTFVNEAENQDAADLVETVAVDVQVFAVADGAAAVVAGQVDVRRAVVSAPAFTERLHAARRAVAHFEQARQIEVDALGLCAAQLGEETGFRRAVGGPLVPVQVDADAAEALALRFFQRDLVAALFQRDLRQRNFSGRWCWCRFSGRRRRHFGAAKVLEQRRQAAIKTLAHGAETPHAVAAVDLGQDHGFFVRKVAACERERHGRSQCHAARRDAAHGAAFERAGKHQLVDGRRQGVQIDMEDRAALPQSHAHGVAGAGELVVKHHVPVVRQLACRVEPKARQVHRRSRRLQRHVHIEGAAAAEVRQLALLSASESVHVPAPCSMVCAILPDLQGAAQPSCFRFHGALAALDAHQHAGDAAFGGHGRRTDDLVAAAGRKIHRLRAALHHGAARVHHPGADEHQVARCRFHAQIVHAHGQLDRLARRAHHLFGHLLAAQVGHRLEFTGLELARVEFQRRMRQVRMGLGRPAFYATQAAAVHEQLHLVRIGEHAYLRRRFRRPVAGDRHHRSAAPLRRLGHAALRLEEVVRILGQTVDAHDARRFQVGCIATAVIEHHPVAVRNGAGIEIVIVRLGQVFGLLQQALFAVGQQLAAAAVRFFEVAPRGLIKTRIHRIVFPVAVLGDDQRLVGLRALVVQPVLARLQINVVGLRRPAGGIRLVARILLVHGLVQRVDQRVGHLRFVERAFPGQHAGVVAVAAHHVGTGFHHLRAEGRIGIEVLPARHARQDHQAQFIGSSHEGRRMRVVRQADVVVAGALDQERIAVLGLRRQRVAHIRIFLVAVHAAQERLFAVDQELALGQLDAADADARVDHVLAALAGDGGLQRIQVGRLGRPQLRTIDLQFAHDVAAFAGRQTHALRPIGHAGGLVEQAVTQFGSTRLVRRIAHLRLHAHGGRGFIGLRIGDENAAARDLLGQHLVADMHGRLDGERDVAVDAAVLDVVEVLERFRAGDGIVLVIDAHHQLVGAAFFQVRRDVVRERQVAAQVLAQVFAIEPHVRHVHRAFEAEDGLFAGGDFGGEILLVVRGALPRVDRYLRFQARRVRQVDAAPAIGRHLVHGGGDLAVVAIEIPGLIEADGADVGGAGGRRYGQRQQTDGRKLLVKPQEKTAHSAWNSPKKTRTLIYAGHDWAVAPKGGRRDSYLSTRQQHRTLEPCAHGVTFGSPGPAVCGWCLDPDCDWINCQECYRFVNHAPPLLTSPCFYLILFSALFQKLFQNFTSSEEARSYATVCGGLTFIVAAAFYITYLIRVHSCYVLKIQGSKVVIGGISGWKTLKQEFDFADFQSAAISPELLHMPKIFQMYESGQIAMDRTLKSEAIQFRFNDGKSISIYFCNKVFEEQSLRDFLSRILAKCAP
uniref:Uncharacterized protein n=1 Tax=Tanacetum cinerariifolium TaxID=118510 RepID=A0A699GFS1_TANCI|nr:hypothetical protein [Tanacetum cinerariifolium]